SPLRSPRAAVPCAAGTRDSVKRGAHEHVAGNRAFEFFGCTGGARRGDHRGARTTEAVDEAVLMPRVPPVTGARFPVHAVRSGPGPRALRGDPSQVILRCTSPVRQAPLIRVRPIP